MGGRALVVSLSLQAPTTRPQATDTSSKYDRYNQDDTDDDSDRYGMATEMDV